VTAGATEQPLGAMKNAIYDRRGNFKNMQRVEHLLTLAQLKRMGQTDARPWRGTSVIRSADPGLGR
jgi:hypothetical protein